MNKIEVKTLKPGYIFSAPVYIDGNNFLVPEQVPLRDKDIERLIAWGITVVETEGVIINKEEVKNESKSGNAGSPFGDWESANAQEGKKKDIRLSISDVQENSVPYRDYKSFIEKLDGILNNTIKGVGVDSRSIDNISTQLIQQLRDHRGSYIGFILGGEVSGHELAKSSINTAILSALTAQELKIASHKILQIVTGALVHDVGMLKLPKEVVNKKGGLSDAELEQVRSHPVHSSKIVTKELSLPQEVNLIALQHHERWDGKGYPDKIPGPDIDLGARIVSVADAFEAMVCQKSYRNSMVGYQAMKNLLSDNCRRFDPNVVKAFTKIMGIYPIGSIVQLNTGAIARVIEVQGDAPLRPKIHMLVNEYGNVLKPEDGENIDLLSKKNLFITKALDPKEFAKRNA